MRIEYHRTLIADRVRNDAFHRALKQAIRPGETIVADIGAGTGLLGLMASRLGAREVYLYEAAEVGAVAAETLRRNKAKGCHLLPCHSTEMVDPPRVDLVVSETLGNYALEEDILTSLGDALARHLKPGGTIIPKRIEQRVAPVVTPRFHEELIAWDRLGFGIDLAHARQMSLNNVYVRTLAPADLLEAMGGSRVWDTIDLTRPNRTSRKGEARWRMARACRVYGFAVWWQAELVAGISLSTAPDAPRTHWEQLYVPLLEPIPLATGEDLAVALRSRSSPEKGTHLAWTATVTAAGGERRVRQALDLDKGYLP
jgi:protein arginine N-methyltransferase 1